MARKILLADDSVTAQNMGRKILADAGYDVLTVNNGSAALKRIAEAKPDLIILDVYMPGYSGLEVCQRLKDSAETAHIPVLLSVGKLEPFKPQEARRVRADAHIVKPFEASELLAALGHLETCIVPPAQRPGFCAPIAGVAEVEPEEESSKAEEASAPANTGRRNGIRSASGKKKKEEVEAAAAADDGAANFRDFKKAEVKPVGDTVFDMPSGVTKEELDALSAIAARLDERTPAADNSAHGEEAGAPVEAPEFPGTSANLEQPQAAEAVTDLPRGITKEELDALSAVAAKLADTNIGTEQVESTAEQASPVLESAQVTAQMAGENLERQQMAIVPPVHGMNEEGAVSPATAWNQVETPAEQAQFAAEGPTTSGQDGQAEPPQEEFKQKVHTVSIGTFADEPAPIDQTDEPIFASALADTSTPSDEELAAALRLLTPATGHATAPAQETSLASGGTVGPQWTAEAVGVTPEEAGVSLEAEMFRTFAGDPAGDPAPEVEPTPEAGPAPEAECVPVVDAVLPRTDAVDNVLAYAAKQVELASCETQKAMAAAAAAESSAAASEDSEIASIVDRVLADLRPKIVEEIARKLGKK